MTRLDGQVAVVTGAASGIGRAILDRFVDEGASVVAVDRGSERTDALRACRERITVVEGDVRTLETNRAAVQAAVDGHGKLDVFVGNAGIFDAHTHLAEIPAGTLKDAAEEIFAVNVVAYLLGAREALVPLRESAGCMIFTASPAGLHAAGGGVLYAASKHAVVGIIRRLAAELAPRVRVNGVAPGGTATDIRGPEALKMADRSISGARMRRDVAEKRGEVLPAGMEPHDHAAAYVFLASRPEAGAVTGHVIEALGPDGVAGLYQRRQRP